MKKYSDITDRVFGPVMAIAILACFIAWTAGKTALFAVVTAGIVAVILSVTSVVDAWRNVWIDRCAKRYSTGFRVH